MLHRLLSGMLYLPQVGVLLLLHQEVCVALIFGWSVRLYGFSFFPAKDGAGPNFYVLLNTN